MQKFIETGKFCGLAQNSTENCGLYKSVLWCKIDDSFTSVYN